MSKKRTSNGNILNYFDSKRVCSTSTTSKTAMPESDSADGVSEVLVEPKIETISCSATAGSHEEQNGSFLTFQTTAHPNDIGHYIDVTVTLTNEKKYKF